jgi:hypothetical protein
MAWKDLACAVFGHAVDNRRFARATRSRRCVSCAAPYLPLDGRTTRVRHTLSCFFGHHTYTPTETRHSHREYMCLRCGHPLLFASGRDPYADLPTFEKKVRYLCGVTGHAVHEVCARNGFTEYACGCGHSFLLPRPGLRRVRHPAVCIAGGHRVSFVERRAGHDEYRCRDCGHPFVFQDAARFAPRLPSPQRAAADEPPRPREVTLRFARRTLG